VRDRIAQLRALGGERGERPVETPLAFVRQPQVGDPGVALGLLALDETGLLRPADELGDGALRELKPLGELGDRGLLGAVAGTLDHQQQEMALWCQAGLPGDPLRVTEEPAQRLAKVGHLDDARRLDTHRPILCANTRATRLGATACRTPAIP
jgi:hypothetical protein